MRGLVIGDEVDPSPGGAAPAPDSDVEAQALDEREICGQIRFLTVGAEPRPIAEITSIS
jgi:hypothetical protein